MAQVTSGLVSIEDGIKKSEEYAPPRKVRVELSFSVGEGEDFRSMFDNVSEAAAARVTSLLSGKNFRVVGGTHVILDGDPLPQDAEAPAAEAPKTRVRRTKAEIEAAKAAENVKDPAAISEDPTGGKEDVIHLPDETANPPANKPAAATDPAAIGDEDFTIGGEDDEFVIEPEVAAISDADLNSAVQKRNAELKDSNVIRALIKSYNPDPTKAFQLREIPAEKRPEFLSQLAALKAAAAA